MQFSHRDKWHNESPEDCAAELNHLYDWAYPHRDMEAPYEYTLRRFLDWLCDRQANYQVEFVKDPVNSNQAVYDIVHWIVVRKIRVKVEIIPKTTSGVQPICVIVSSVKVTKPTVLMTHMSPELVLRRERVKTKRVLSVIMGRLTVLMHLYKRL